MSATFNQSTKSNSVGQHGHGELRAKLVVGSVTTSESLVLCLLFPTFFSHGPPSKVTLAQPTVTYDHTCQRTRDPVRSPLVKLARAELVLRSVTTGESSVLYVFLLLYSPVEHPNPP